MLRADWREMGGGIVERAEPGVVAAVNSGWSTMIGVTVEDLGGDSLERLTK